MPEDADHIEEITNELIEANEEISKLKGDKDTFEMVKSGVGSFELATDGETAVTIKGIALKEGRWKNYFYPKDEIIKGAETLIGKPLVVDHGKGVRDIVGQIITAGWDEKVNGLEFKAEVIEKNVATLIKRGLVRGVSVGSDFDDFDGPNGLSAKNIQFYELSLTTHPACLNGVSEILDREFPNSEELRVPAVRGPLAEENVPWRLSTAEKNDLPDSAFAYIHPDYPKVSQNKNLRKLPHHKLIGRTYKVVWRGVVAAMAVMMGARGGVDIPSESRRRVYNHLASHYKMFDRKVPEYKELSELEEESIEKYATDKDLSNEGQDNTSLKEKEEDTMSEKKTEDKAQEPVSETPETTTETPPAEETKEEETKEEAKDEEKPVDEEKKASVDVNVNVKVEKEVATEPEEAKEEEPVEEEAKEEEKAEDTTEEVKEEEKTEEPEKEAEEEPEKTEDAPEEAETEEAKEDTEKAEEKDPYDGMTTAELLTERAKLRNPDTVPK